MRAHVTQQPSDHRVTNDERITVANAIGPQAGGTGSAEMSASLKKPEPTTAGMASRNEYLAAATRW